MLWNFESFGPLKVQEYLLESYTFGWLIWFLTVIKWHIPYEMSFKIMFPRRIAAQAQKHLEFLEIFPNTNIPKLFFAWYLVSYSHLCFRSYTESLLFCHSEAIYCCFCAAATRDSFERVFFG